ncbi:MAG: energy transducer TonB [Cyclobacteriaceae bacterium]
MPKSFLLTFILLVTVYSSLFSQRTISGRIFDEHSYKPILGASIKVNEEIPSVNTDSLGFFVLRITEGDSIFVDAKGYESLRFEIPVESNFFLNLRSLNPPPPKDIYEEIFVIVDEPANYPGGINNFYDYVNKKLKYPKDAFKAKVQGRVFVSFVIDTTGLIIPELVEVAKGLFPSCDEEAKRLFIESPVWIPGRQRGQKIRQRMVLPITFQY